MLKIILHFTTVQVAFTFTEFLPDPPQDDNLDVTTYIVLILEKNSVQISDLTPGTAYLFRVQALSSDGSPGGSSMEEQFETSPEGTEENHHGENVSQTLFKNEISLMCFL